MYHFFVANFEYSFSVLFNKFIIFCVSIIYKMFTEFCKNSKVVSSDFSAIKNIVTPLSCHSILPMKLVCCGKLDLLQLSYNFLCNKQNLINYQSSNYYYSCQLSFRNLLLHFLLANRRKFFHWLRHRSLLFVPLVHNNVRKNLLVFFYVIFFNFSIR